ncbi:hypothetical protein niasHT_020250 [Heterodera trifolii]|uniref:Uncharacterized protein n=1 Tax=Heterodera trifolii TaxID=157864 RepID=A0ABD2JGQ2_9BILA
MSLSTFRHPTNLTWIVEEGCKCLRADAVCIRPEDYTKPIECLNAAHVGSFAEHLLAEPCRDINMTDLLLQINNNNNNNDKGSVSGLIVVFFLFILITQFCIFWLLFVRGQVRTRRPHRRQRAHQELPPEGAGRPLTVFCPVPRSPAVPHGDERAMRRSQRVGLEKSPAVPHGDERAMRRSQRVGLEKVSTSGQLETIDEAVEVKE